MSDTVTVPTEIAEYCSTLILDQITAIKESNDDIARQVAEGTMTPQQGRLSREHNEVQLTRLRAKRSHLPNPRRPHRPSSAATGKPVGPGIWVINDAGQAVEKFGTIAEASTYCEYPGDRVQVVD